MSDRQRVLVEESFEVEVPPGWVVEQDEEGGVLISAPDGHGLLHLASFVQPEGDMPDPAEELYLFLEDQGVELEEDEVEDVPLEEGAEMAICEYLTEGEDEDEELATYWMVGVATAPGNLVFGNYSCPAGEQAEEREVIRRVLGSLRLRARS